MNRSLPLFLLVAQSAALAALAASELAGVSSATLRYAALAVLGATIALLWLRRLSARAELKRFSEELRRALAGNLKTRLLAKGGGMENEIVFSVNELLERLEQVQIEAVRSETARKSLLSGISHDIRTPLTSIIGYVDALKDDIAVTEREKMQYLHILSDKASGLKKLIDELFTMAKLDADEFPMTPETLDLAEMARETLIAFLPELKRKGMALHVGIPDTSCPVAADRLSVLRIIGNVVKNAAAYGEQGKELGVELNETPDAFELRVWDRGPGISAGELPRIFDKMYRGDPSRKSSDGGSGLGLTIAKALIEKNGGSIRAESVPWEKTTLILTFKKPLRNG